jgi:malonate-semialdehyde dehydrogenase (acetylating)/methylmalonate-semialdehyde dehydrogenase
MHDLQHWIAGRLTPGVSGRTAPITDPADGTTIAAVPLASIEEVDRAVQAARAAAGDWGATSLARRTRILFAFRDLVDRHRDDLAAVIVREHGKVRSDALGDFMQPARGTQGVGNVRRRTP